MVKAFVHGVPETAAVWGDLVAALAERGVDDVVLLSPPGFGAAIPAGFTCTAPAYAAWLIGELEALGDAVDLVGHDWGAGHVYAVAADRPDLLRSWAADCCGIIHPDYVWHPTAKIWQTPGEGETLIKEMVATERSEFASRYGILDTMGPAMADGFDEPMGRAILTLYRSAVQPYLRDLGGRLSGAERRPALMFETPEDPYTNPGTTAEVAASVGARVVTLPGTGHWWMGEEPARAADALVAFWAQLP